jgi:antibiotic biosynthesis monooxygenase (ABM) superfamily enzyme
MSDAGRPLLENRGSRASSVIVHHIPMRSVERFLEWQRGITQAVEEFSGYQATDMYPPARPLHTEWVVVIHFDNSETLQCWLDSPVRADWTAKLPAELANFHLKTLSAGFGPWFSGLVDRGDLPPHWKMALAVLLGLYPTVMFLSIFVVLPHDRLGTAITILIGNILGVCLLEWVVMPVLNLVLGPWLRANDEKGRAISCAGLFLILGALGILTLLFRQITG